MERCVILNGDYSYLNTVSFKRAITLYVKEVFANENKVEVIQFSDREIRCADGSCLKIPLVMKLVKVIRMIYKNKVPWNRSNLMVRDRNRCMYCGVEGKKLTIDHVLPSSRGGKTTFENCVASCFPCNHKKGNRTPKEAGMPLLKYPKAPTISEFIRLKMHDRGIMAYLKELGVY